MEWHWRTILPIAVPRSLPPHAIGPRIAPGADFVDCFVSITG